MPHPRLYHELAELWPLVSPPEDYAEEARVVLRRTRQRLGRPPRGQRWSLLELGSGGGHLLSHLTGDFHVEAVDPAPRMIAQSRRLNPGVRHHLGDMRRIRLRRSFDIVLIHDAIGYMLSESDLRQAMRTAAIHLHSGGALIVMPDYLHETFIDGEAAQDANTAEDIQVSFVSQVHDANPRDGRFELLMVFMIRRAGTLRVVEDRHRCGLFSRADWTHALLQSGFTAVTIEVHAPGRPAPILTARRRT